MPLPRPYRLAIELGLLALAVCLAAFGVSAELRATFDDVPPPGPDAAPLPEPAPAVAPLEAFAVIATRDVFNPSGQRQAPAALRLWGVGVFGGESRAVIEDLATHRQDLYRIGDEV